MQDLGADLTADPGPTTGAFSVTATLSENPNNSLSTWVRVTTEHAATVRVSFWQDPEHKTEIPSSPLSTDHELLALGMRSNSSYQIQATATDADGLTASSEVLTFNSGDLPEHMPEFEVVIHDPDQVSPGITFFGVGENGDTVEGRIVPMYLGVDEEGEVVWYYLEAEGNRKIVDRSVRPLSDGTLLISLNREFRIIDLAGETLRSISGSAALGGIVHHDADVLPNGNIIVLSQETRTVDVPTLGGEVEVKGDTVLEVDADGQVVWTWSSHDHLDNTRFPGPLSQNKKPQSPNYDWTHANALSYHPEDDSIIISLRHQNWVIKIDHGTGEVLWKLGEEGDFSLESGAWFYSQHNPRLEPDGTILIYDNGNERPGNTKYSRAVRYQLDVEAMTAHELWSFQTDRYTDFLGGVQALEPNNALVCAGGNHIAPGSGPPTLGVAQVVEVSAEMPPSKIWELTATGAIYRATRIPSFWWSVHEDE